MYDINLLSGSGNKNKKERKYFLASGRLLGIVFTAVLLLSLIGYGTIALIQWKFEANKAAIEQRIRSASPILSVKNDIQVKEDKISQLSGLSDTVTLNSTLNTRIIDSIAEVMPENIFVLNYLVDESGNLNIVGKSKDMDSIAYFIANLKRVGVFGDVYLSNLSNLSSDSNSGSTGYNFSALINIKK